MTPAELRAEGQSRSLFSLSEDTWDTFEAIIRTVTPGTHLHVNGLRELLDIADIPPKARGGLFSGAVKAGLIKPVFTADGYEVRVPSSGESAHCATVRLYVRCAA